MHGVDDSSQRWSASYSRIIGAWAVFAIGLGVIGGCASWGDPIVDNPAVEHYRRLAEEIAIPTESPAPEVETISLGEGRPLVPPKREELREISLTDAVRIAMQNNRIIRQNAQFMSPNNQILVNPDGVPSIFDAQIQNSGVVFGSRGTDAALSDFDPRFSTTIKGGREATGQDSSIQQGAVLTNDFTQAQFRVDQQLLSGGIVSLSQTWNYSDNNAPVRLFGDSYSGALGLDFRQPLWAGSGSEYTAIAGPVSQQARGFSFVNQGVVIARINNKLAEIDVEENILNLLREVGDLYWDLYQAYHAAEAEEATAVAAKQMWDDVNAKFKSDIVSEAEDAQAEESYHDSVTRHEQALSNLFQTEARFRRLLGMTISDGRLLHPNSEPKTDFAHDRSTCLYEALTNRLELRRQKTNLHSIELQLVAARNLANPRLDFVAGGSLNGFGHHLFTGGTGDGHTQEGFNNAYATMLRGKETSWNLGVEYTVPLWLRSQKAQVHQLEFRLVKARAALASQEDEIARELNSVLQTMQNWRAGINSSRRRLLAARRRLESNQAEYRVAGRIGVDPVLRAQMSFTQAKISYYRSLAEYNKAHRDLLYRMGRLLNGDDIELLDHEGQPLHPPSDPLKDLLKSPPTPKPEGPKPLAPPTAVVPDFGEAAANAVPAATTGAVDF